MKRALVIFLAFMCLGAIEPGEKLDDPALEARARAITKELRCLVCQNQSIDDSDAPLARDLRDLVRQRIKAGESDEEVLDYVVARYGEFVLLRPPFRLGTLALWLAPFAALGAGAIVIYVFYRRRGPRPEPQPLSPDEEARLEKLTKRREERA
ncbi:cytochrome c-type biogenesis protein [Tepidicaulis sp. LMO-SS28]|uniref:cytochrome c-type biogenesis protein n=1 Tax=Tepidicaulis sp. LMO-SS28 TaxID=3447455 RepID=UPI003EE01F80